MFARKCSSLRPRIITPFIAQIKVNAYQDDDTEKNVLNKSVVGVTAFVAEIYTNTSSGLVDYEPSVLLF